jgi:hypothetical protein
MNMQEMMRQAQRMQKKLAQIREEAGQKTVEGTAGGGMVVVVANGKSEILSVKIQKDVIDANDPEMLQDLIVAATNQALQRANEMLQQELSALTGGAPIPGLF